MNTNRLIFEIQNILNMPLPSIMEDCLREIEILTDRQCGAGDRLRELLQDTAQESVKKNGELLPVQNFDEQKNYSIDEDVKWNRSATKYSMRSRLGLQKDSDSTNDEENNRTVIGGSQNLSLKRDENFYRNVSQAISQSLTYSIANEEIATSEQSSPLIIAQKELQQNHIRERTLKSWNRSLVSLFFMTNEDKNG